MTRKTLLLLLAALPLAASAFDDNGSYFEHKNWEIACDNTGTCRAAGYQAGEEDQAISILLMRDAGADAAITGEITVIDPNGDDKNRQALSGHLYLDDKNPCRCLAGHPAARPESRGHRIQRPAPPARRKGWGRMH